MGLFNHFPQSKGLEGTPLGAYVFSINVVQRAGLFTGADQLGAERQDRKVLCRLPGFNREKLTCFSVGATRIHAGFPTNAWLSGQKERANFCIFFKITWRDSSRPCQPLAGANRAGND